MYISMKVIKLFIGAIGLCSILIAMYLESNQKISRDLQKFLNGLGIVLLLLAVFLSSIFGLTPDD